jgi:hypothetical protein
VWCKQQTTKEPTKKDKKKKEAKEQFSSSAEKIMAVEPSIEVNWTIPKAFQENAERRVRRFPQNPEKHWGPKKAATGIKRKADDQNPEIS